MDTREILEQKLAYILQTNPFMQHLGIQFIKLEPGNLVGTFQYDKKLLNPYGSMHGGVLYSIADIITGFAACSFGTMASTIDGSMNYLSPVQEEGTYTCEAIMVRQGKQVSVYKAEIRDEKKNLYATGTFTFYMLKEDLLHH